MGYTHYAYRKNAPIADAEWNAFCADVHKILAAHSDIVCYEYDQPNRPPEVSAEWIKFNGKDSAGHETFVFGREYAAIPWRGEDEFFFCKTARKPYDEAVVDVMACAEHHFPDLLRISSDGGDEVFRPYDELVAKYGLNQEVTV